MAETLGVILAAAGAGLVYAAVTNQNPATELREALTTGRTEGASPISAATATDVPASTSTGGPTATPALVAIRGGHRLDANAASAFGQWESAFGQSIPITGAWRSSEAQQAGYDANPDRFAKPGTSAHEEGRAVDVNLGALGISVQGSTPGAWIAQNDVYRRLVAAATRTGWCNYQLRKNSTGGKVAEPWHFSFGVCK